MLCLRLGDELPAREGAGSLPVRRLVPGRLPGTGKSVRLRRPKQVAWLRHRQVRQAQVSETGRLAPANASWLSMLT